MMTGSAPTDDNSVGRRGLASMNAGIPRTGTVRGYGGSAGLWVVLCAWPLYAGHPELQIVPVSFVVALPLDALPPGYGRAFAVLLMSCTGSLLLPVWCSATPDRALRLEVVRRSWRSGALEGSPLCSTAAGRRAPAHDRTSYPAKSRGVRLLHG